MSNRNRLLDVEDYPEAHAVRSYTELSTPALAAIVSCLAPVGARYSSHTPRTKWIGHTRRLGGGGGGG